MEAIVDTNIFMAVILEEPEKQKIIDLTSDLDIISPEILPYEIGNAFSALAKRKQISEEEILQAFQAFQNIPVRLVSLDIQAALKIALKYNIYAYDAYFLQCAKSLSHPLLSLDKKMNEVAIDLKISLLE